MGIDLTLESFVEEVKVLDAELKARFGARAESNVVHEEVVEGEGKPRIDTQILRLRLRLEPGDLQPKRSRGDRERCGAKNGPACPIGPAKSAAPAELERESLRLRDFGLRPHFLTISSFNCLFAISRGCI